MKTYTHEDGALRLNPCSYGVSQLTFRGPQRQTDGRFVLFLGGSDTFGRYVPEPFSHLIEFETGETCVNLGCQAAGPDVYLKDSTIQALCQDASVTVIQVIGATNLTNAYYKVHPRRNDRFIAPTKLLTELYSEVDFTEFSFTGHLISRLRALDEARFELVRCCLQATWKTRMEALISQISGPVLLLWFASRPATGAMHLALHETDPNTDPNSEPLFVTAEMIEGLRGAVSDVIEVVSDRGEMNGMSFAQLDFLAAYDSLGIAAHRAAAAALHGPLSARLS